jgi:serine protease Do
MFLLTAAMLAVGVTFCSTAARASELRQSPIVKAVQKVRPSVVNIRGEKTVGPSGAQAAGGEAPRRVNGMGTGIVIDSRGYILTNYHVVDGVHEIQVTLADERHFVAALIARDLETDLAIIKIEIAEKLPVITIGTSSDLMAGESVIAVGNAYGYENTVTRGIISALHRAVQVSDAQFYDDLIQTDASINPGNSGGPLLNIDGEMIGINVAVRAGAQGIGFAIPVDKALNVAATLLGSSSVNKAWHGAVTAADSSPSQPGVNIATVEKKSPAADAGLQSGDIVTAVENTEVKRALDFHRAMLNRKPGDKVSLAIARKGNPLTLSLTLADLPAPVRPAASPAWELLGLELKTIPVSEFQQKYQSRYRGGLMVTDVRPNSPASAQGIRAGDVLVGMHVWETISLDNIAYILKRPDFATLNPVKFFILRGSDTLYGYMPVTTTVARPTLDR